MRKVELTGGRVLTQADLNRSGALPREVMDAAEDIVRDVRDRGDAAVREYCTRFDGACPESFRVPDELVKAAPSMVDPEFLESLTRARDQILAFHQKEREESWFTTRPDGTLLGVQVTPVASAAVYVPGGRAQYPSTVLMDTIPAKVAGVPRVVMVTPPQRDGSLSAYTLAAAALAGVDEVYAVGGAQAIGAVAYGTESIPACDKIVGPGNAYVAAAKRYVSGDVGIDMVAGPSEVCVLADATARLASLGLETVDYRAGARCRVDAALRRHVVTQANQARNDLLVRRMDEWGVDLVFVSAHYGARPSHAVWQGRVFSRSGSSPKYPPLVESTGYGTAGGLCGVNCRHTMTPYVEGLSRLPSTDYAAQARLTGMTSDEYYAATQAQRRLEARVRETKREVALGEAAGADVTVARVRLGELQGRLREHCRANHLRRDYERERAYGLPEGMAQPRALKALPLEQRERFIPREQRAAGTAYDVSRRAVNGPSYRRKFDSAGLPKRTAATCYTEARRILRDRDGTDGERMSVVSWRGGRLVCDTFGSHAQKAQAGLTLSQYERAASTDGGVVIMHNHPASTRPSWADLKSVAANEFVRASLVLCHDGTVYLVSGTSPQLIATYEAILKKLRDQLGGTIPDEPVKMRALDELYGRNEVERWLRIRRL